MKTKKIAISILLVLAMVLGLLAVMPFAASAASTTPDPTKIPAETIYVGGVALNAGQYVKNGETTATTGQPVEDTSGFAWYMPDGTLLLVDYTYTGKGYEYSNGNYALVYSTGTLYIALGGENTLKQTSSYNTGIYTVGALQIGNIGSLTIEGDNCACLYSNNEIIFVGDLGTVNLKTTGNATAITSYDNDEDALDEEAIIVNGGDIYVETFYPISDLTINYGALTVSSPQYPLSEVPDISNYDGNYTLTVSENEDGSNPTTYNQDTITTFDINKITDYKYLRLAPPAKTVINSISVSGADLPEVGETKDAMEFTPDTLTYGGEYKMVGRGFQKYTGTEWVDVSDTESLEYGVKYRVSLVLAPSEGYVFADSITSDDVTFNGKDAEFLGFANAGTAKYARIALEFSYEAPATDYGIIIADKDDSGETVGVLITKENYTDVLGDGTVSYDPTTNTLTLNGYKYEGGGFGDGTRYGILVESIITLNIVLKGENIIDVTNTGILERMRRPSIGIYTWETDVVITGDGSLIISATDGGLYIYGEEGNPSLEIKGGTVTVNAPWGIGTASFKMSGGNLTVNAQEVDGDIASAIYSYEFKMTGGNLKITSAGLGVEMWHDSHEDAPPMISGGSLDISVAIAGGAFCYYNYADDVCVAIAPDLTNYVGAYKLTAGASADITDAVDYNASDIATYKYIKLEPAHTRSRH